MSKLTLHIGDKVKIQRDMPYDRFEGKLAAVVSVHPVSGCYIVTLDDVPNKEFVFFEHELVKLIY